MCKIQKHKYVLVTPARNEEAYIEKTIQSVISQTVLPQKWAIVSDGSTDRTDDIVRSYEAKHQFVQFIRVGGSSDRNFGSKIDAFNAGHERIKHVAYDFIGNLDADISFQPDYFERLLHYFSQNSKLGICGGIIHDYYNGKLHNIRKNVYSVPGAVQFFRKECYENIGGYVPLRYGLVDAVAEVRARMFSWETRAFPDLIVYHYRATGSEGRSLIGRAYRSGKLEFMFGVHPVYHVVRLIKEIPYNRPFLIACSVKAIGFWSSYLLRYKRPVSDEFVRFLRSEEWKKLKSFFKKSNEI